MKRSEIKRRPLADTVLATLEPDTKEYREHDGNSLYLRVRTDGNKSWQLRYKKPDGKWSWLGLGSYPEVSGALARHKAAELRADSAQGSNPLATKRARKAADLEAASNTFERLAREHRLEMSMAAGAVQDHSDASRYYYRLTASLIWKRMGAIGMC